VEAWGVEAPIDWFFNLNPFFLKKSIQFFFLKAVWLRACVRARARVRVCVRA
jgi:hypothetical protein